ncbi:MAG: pacearchaeosortase [Nanoarchaeota archaeon]
MARSSNNQSVFIFIRYLLLLLIALFMMFSSAFYDVFLKLTIYPVNFLLNFLYSSAVSADTIFVQGFQIAIIPACVAVSAYFLLFILNFTTPMKIKNRIKLLIFSFAALLLVNVLRIFILSVLFIKDYVYFDIIHKFFWYFLSTILVLIIWFSSTAIFKIRGIPVYTDFKTLIKNIKNK